MLDSKDQKIIRLLREDSRATIRDISKKTKIRPSTVHQRIQKLKENGVIERFTLKLNNSAVGEGFVVFVLVKTEGNVEASITFQGTGALVRAAEV